MSRSNKGSTFPSMETSHLRIRLLGGFEIQVGDVVADPGGWRLQKARSLVKLLALAPGQRLLRDQVLDLLWPDLDPSAAANNLYQVLHTVRRALVRAGSTRAVELSGGVLILGGSPTVDVDEFEAAAAAARRSNDRSALRAAVSLYRGDLLPEDRYEDWAAARREALRQTYLTLLLDLARAEVEAGEPATAIEALRAAVAHEPTLEEAHAELMRAYALSGQRQQALRQYQQLRETLTRELEIEPDDQTQELLEGIRAGTLSTPERVVSRSGPARRTNLPADLTSFIGRDEEARTLAQHLASRRLVTLVGPPGVGKTRLAVHVARTLADDFIDGVWLVDLAPLPAGDHVQAAVGQTLGISEESGSSLLESLTEALAGRSLLLLLDNCEHLIEDCAVLAEALLSACPGIHILATSREILNIAGEVTVPVAPLAIPEEWERSDPLLIDSMRLLVDRVAYRQPGFVLTEDLIPSAVEICRRLEGLPLAIELTAARVGALSLPQIAARLSDVLPLLTAGSRTASTRQRSLRGALNWSYDLLPESDARFFRHLAPFAGGWTQDAAAAVAGEDGMAGEEVLDVLSHLVDRSLVTAEPHADEMRYRLLEPIRQYAVEQVRGAGEETETRARHARYFVHLAEHARALLDGPEQGKWLERLEREHDNLRGALQWLLDRGEDELALRLAAALWLFWYIRGYVREGETWLRAVLARSGAPTSQHASALRGLGAVLYKQRRYAEARTAFGAALALYRELDDRAGVSRSLSNLAMVHADEGDVAGAIPLQEEVLAMARDSGDTLTVTTALTNLAVAQYVAGAYEQARDLQRESLRLQRELGDLSSVAVSLNNLGELSLLLDDADGARSAYTEALSVGHDVGESEVVASCFDGLAKVALDGGQLERAVRLHGASDALRHRSGSPVRPQEEPGHAATWSEVRAALGTARFDQLVAEGVALPLAQAVSYALEYSSASDPSRPPWLPVLTPRERAVAELAAQGLTNRAIAHRLAISDRTVETHLRRAMQKWGVTSRAELAACITETD